MGRFVVPGGAISREKVDDAVCTVLKPETWEQFSPSILGLGNLTKRATQTDVICAFLDLGGFTNFCKQVDPYLVLPDFLNIFLKFLFDEIKSETLIKKTSVGRYAIYHSLPFMIKFMGDGIMVLWDTENMGNIEIANIFYSLRNLCGKYRKTFYVKHRMEFSDLPPRLRCGIARGHAYSVGNGEDYVGACINIASRLQKLGTTVAARRGISFTQNDENKSILVKSVRIRGIGDAELVCIHKADFEELSDEEKGFFSDP